MGKMAFILRVREGSEAEYVDRHKPDRIWPSIVAACQNAGMRNYNGFLGGPDGRTVFASFEADDPEACLVRLSQDPANAEWQQYMAPLMEAITDLDNGSIQFLAPVFEIE
jgi:L-rhamnose mutarotase